MKYKHLGFIIVSALSYVLGVASHIMFGRLSFLGIGLAMVAAFFAVNKIVNEWDLGTRRIGVRRRDKR